MKQIPTAYTNEKLCSNKLKLGGPQEKERAEEF